MTPDLFPEQFEGLTCLPGLAAGTAGQLWEAVQTIAAAAPFRQMVTPWGKKMSVGMTNCGAAGWVTDLSGYRYTETDPETGQPWPPMPKIFLDLAQNAAARGGFTNFTPDACLINRYAPGARMSLHQDRNERDFTAPIVSVSLGLPAMFLWGGPARTDKTNRILLENGDVLVWGGSARLYFHGIAPLKEGEHPLTGRARINLTFRRAM
ncbi:MAG TPA: DNA oxidative demethylase AlkB [Acidocella sp.]|uniref:DNA oxidative demethylase AlkB n=1 Tax=Acidocella sp. TaxID=50710 RepID=UPI002B8639CC|nr:DNA oxidative demethylase AlkB [Acidocella sp.]HVE22092.1 DNA oxidative demethylase AlkB [Acidocella sp.]